MHGRLQGAFHTGRRGYGGRDRPGQGIESDERISRRGGIHVPGNRLDGGVENYMGPVTRGTELVAGILIGGFQTGAGENVVELVIEQVFPAFFKGVVGVFPGTQQPGNGSEPLGGHQGMFDFAVQALNLGMSGITSPRMVLQLI